MRTILRNLGYLYGRYEKKFYIESYLHMTIGLIILYTLKLDLFSKEMIVLTIINIITYPFTRFFYYKNKEYLVKGAYFNSIIIRYVARFLAFMILWMFSFLIGSWCVVYILLNGNEKEYNKRKLSRNESNF